MAVVLRKEGKKSFPPARPNLLIALLPFVSQNEHDGTAHRKETQHSDLGR
jgi:hypothetical protein